MMPAVAPASADMDVRQYSKMAEFWRTDSSLYATASANKTDTCPLQYVHYNLHTQFNFKLKERVIHSVYFENITVGLSKLNLSYVTLTVNRVTVKCIKSGDEMPTRRIPLSSETEGCQ